jgi:hypothetical protein
VTWIHSDRPLRCCCCCPPPARAPRRAATWSSPHAQSHGQELAAGAGQSHRWPAHISASRGAVCGARASCPATACERGSQFSRWHRQVAAGLIYFIVCQGTMLAKEQKYIKKVPGYVTEVRPARCVRRWRQRTHFVCSVRRVRTAASWLSKGGQPSIRPWAATSGRSI